MSELSDPFKKNVDEEIVVNYFNSKIYGFLLLFIITIIFVILIFIFNKTIIFDFFSYFEIYSLKNYIERLLQSYSLTEIIALFGLIIGLISAYLYFWHTVSTIWDDPERKGGKQVSAFKQINSIISNTVWLLILFIYILFIKVAFGEAIVVLFVVGISGLYGYLIFVSYERLLSNFDALILLYDFVNKPTKKTEIQPFLSKSTLIWFDIRKQSADLIFLLTIITLVFGVMFSFNFLSILTMELFLIRYFINTAYTNRVPNSLKIILKSGEQFDSFIIQESPSYYHCLIKGDKHDKIEYIMKDSVAKFTPLI